MASQAFFQAFVEIVPDASKLRSTMAKQFESAGGDAGRAGGASAGKGLNSGILGSVGRLATPLAAAVAGLGIGKIFSDSINNASDFSESDTAITAVFGPADKLVQDFAKTSATALGQSANATLDAARVFGTFGKAAGLSGDDLAGFSTEFITLAGDLASFNNTTPEQAIQALGAGLRGESEPLRQYGVLLDDAALKARATELGIYSGTGALTQQQKVLASQAEILAQTSTQQGDFAKTSGGLANQQRILSAGLGNLSTAFGAILLPVMLTIVGFLNTSVVPAFQGLVSMLSGGEVPAGVSGFLGAFEPLISFFQTIGEAFTPVLSSLIGPLVQLAAALSPVHLILTALLPILPQLASLVASLAEPLGALLVGAFTALSGVLGFVIQALTSLATFISENLTMVLGFAAAIGGAVLAFQAYQAVLTIVRGVTMAWAAVQAVLNLVLLANPIGIVIAAIGALVAAIIWVATQTTFFQDVWAAVASFFVDTWNNVASFFRGIWEGIVGFVTGYVNTVRNIITAVIRSISSTWNSIWSGISSFFADTWTNIVNGVSNGLDTVIGFFTSLPGKIIATLGNLGSLLLGSGKSLIQGFIDGIENMIGGVGDAVGGVMDFVGGFFPNSPAERGPFSGSGWTNLKRSGLAIGEQFGAGLTSSRPVVDMASMVSIPSVRGRFDFDGSAAGARSQPVDVRVELVPHDSEFGRAIDARVFVNNEQQTTVLQNGRRRL